MCHVEGKVEHVRTTYMYVLRFKSVCLANYDSDSVNDGDSDDSDDGDSDSDGDSGSGSGNGSKSTAYWLRITYGR